MGFAITITLFLVLFSCLAPASAVGIPKRKYADVLTVPNRAHLGNWGKDDFCLWGFAYGFSLKVEPYIHMGDNTALNGIRLYCTDGMVLESLVGGWGSWSAIQYCPDHKRKNSLKKRLVSFSMRVEKSHERMDDAGAVNIMFNCSDGTVLTGESFECGFWGPWSSSCKTGAIIGLKTRVQRVSGGRVDDTSLNDVQFYCGRYLNLNDWEW